jgi:uncharacterized HAD superfamily protein
MPTKKATQTNRTRKHLTSAVKVHKALICPTTCIQRKGEKMNLGFDIDGVIADFCQPLTITVQKRYGLALKRSDIYCFDLDVVLGITRSEEEALIVEVLKQDLPVTTGAVETLLQLSREGHSIHLLTSRYSHLRDVTESWLKDKSVPYTQLHLLDEGKKHLAKVDQLEVVVEDSMQEALGWVSKVKAVLIFDQPWNRTFNVRNLTKRVHSWQEIYREIQRLK